MEIHERSKNSSSMVLSSDRAITRLIEELEMSVEQATEVVHRYSQGNTHLTEIDWRKLCGEYPMLLAIPEERRLVDFSRHSYEDKTFLSFLETEKIKEFMFSATAKIISVIEGLVAGGMAGATAKTIIAPGDRIKIIYQVDSKRQFSFGNAVKTGKRIVEHGGVIGLWRGNGATMMRVIPYASISFMTFDQYHHFYKSFFAKDTVDDYAILTRFLSGASAGATATVFTYPLDLLRARYAAHWAFDHNRYPSYISALKEIYCNEGPRALFGGLSPTLLGIMPYAGCSFACFETLKASIIRTQGYGQDRDIPTVQRLAAGSLSGLFAQSATYPLDIVRRRMQVTPGKYRTVLHALRDIYATEGVKRGLYKGLSMNWIKGPIAVATSFTVNDLVKQRIRRYNAKVVAHPDFEQGTEKLTKLELALSGGTAAGIAKIWTAPIDRLKIIYTVGFVSNDSHNYFGSAFSAMKMMYRETPHMWQGSGAMVLRVIPYGAITYAAFDHCQLAAERLMFATEPNVISNFAAGALAASLATAILYPIDLMRARMATYTKGQFYPSYWIGLKETVADGGIKALYKGAKPALMGIAPLAGISFSLYEYSKSNLHCDTFSKQLAAGAAAGIVGQLASYPFNVVRRRAQVAEIVENGIHEASIFSTMRQIAHQEGFYRGLYARMPLGWMLGSMTIGLSFAINDQCKRYIAQFRKKMYHDILPY